MPMVRERSGVDKIAPYQAAKSLESIKREYGLSQVIKLAGNENRMGCSARVGEALNELNSQFSFYPDPNCTILRERLSTLHHVSSENLIFGNGSFELISLAAHAFLGEGEESVIPDPSFGWYRNVTLQMNGTPVMVPLKDFTIDTGRILEIINERTKIIWICNPNNPTGTILAEDQLNDFINRVPKHVLIVLDEAYIDFTEEPYFDTVDLIKEHKNIILLRTFSKLYGLASFRIGYGIGDKELIERINRVRSPINVNFSAQKAAEVSLDDEAFKNSVLNNNRKGLNLYYTELEKLGFPYIRSNGNFLLIQTGKKPVDNTFLQNGIIVRNAGEFGLDGWIRVSVGTYEENEKVIEVLKIIAESQTGRRKNDYETGI